MVGGCYLAGKMPELEEWARSLNRFRILSYLDLRVKSAGLIGGRRLTYLQDHFGDMVIEDFPTRLRLWRLIWPQDMRYGFGMGV